MAYEFTKLSEVLDAETVSDECNVIVEDGGEIKKTAKSNIGKAQVQADWNQTDPTQPDYIKNKLSCDVPYQQLVTDSDGNAKWEDRLAYTQTIPGSDGPIITFRTELNTISPLTLSEPLIVDAPYTVNVGDDKCKTTCTTDGEHLYIVVSVQGSTQGSLIVDDPINNPLVALWNGAVTNKKIEIVRESQEEIKQIDPKYIKDMYYDNLQSASYALYTGGFIGFPRSELDIPLEMWKLLLDENATITDETTGSVMTNRTVVGSAAGERVCYDTGLPGIPSLFISTMYPQAYLVVSSAPDGRLGEKRTIKVSIGTIKQIDPKFIPSPNVIVNITWNEDRTGSADKTYAEVKALIDSGADVKCRVENSVADYVGLNGQGTVMCFEATAFEGPYLKLFIWFAPDEIFLEVFPLSEMLLPEVSTSDNSKFLSVVNGTWQASSNLIVPSSTSGSSKKFKITVNDSGAITATEV